MQAPSAVVPTLVVSVAIDPPDAEVSVDGRTALLKDAVLTIEGSLGSSHVVRVSAHGQTETKDVIVTEQGAVPGRVAVAASSVKTAATQAPNAKKGSLAPRTTEPAKPPPPPPGEIYLGR